MLEQHLPLSGESAVTGEAPQPPTSRGALVFRRFMRHRLAVAGVIMLILLFLLAFAGPHLSRWDYESVDNNAYLQPPSATHWFGTTQIGQDVYAQTLRGLQKSLIIGFLTALLTTAMAGAVGASAGYFGKWTDKILSWIVDLLLVIPAFFIVAILSPTFRGKTWLIFVLLLSAFSWMVTARVVRSLTLSLKDREFVHAARYVGVPARRIIGRHILPNMSSFLIIGATLGVGGAILAETGLSFLGFGVQPPDVSLGTLISAGTEAALTYPWLFLFAGGLLILTVLSVAVVGDGLRDALDPTATTVSPRVAKKSRRAAGVIEAPAELEGTRLEGSPIAGVTTPRRILEPEAQLPLAPPEAIPEPAPEPVDPRAVLQVRGLTVSFPTESGPLTAVRGISYSLAPGEVLGIVGESGSGKTVAALAVLGLLPARATVSGSATFKGRELIGLGDRELSAVRGKGIAMVFQDPLSSLTPVYTVGDQIAEAVLVHRDVSKEQARERAVQLLDLVGIPNACERAGSFPHEFSGGMRQRVMIAMAMANDPDVIIADEPTTALDVTIQAQIVEVLKTAQRETGAAILIITHDLGLVAGFADRVLVMYAGKVVEQASVDELFTAPRMPYTLGLLGSLPRADASLHGPLTPVEGTPPSMVALPPGCPFAPRCPLRVQTCVEVEPPLAVVRGGGHRAACHRSGDIEAQGWGPADVFPPPAEAAPYVAAVRPDGRVVEVHDLVRHFPLTKGAIFRRQVGTVRAVDGVSFDIAPGETLGLVGESGCGKTTTIGEILSLVRPMRGSVRVLGQDTAALGRGRKRIRRSLGVVFQDPMDSLDPKMPIGDILAEPMQTHGVPKREHAERTSRLLRMVGLEPSHAGRYPHEFSGGQRQRIGIARALALEPRLVVLDEPVSALDVSIRAGVVNLLMQLRKEMGLSYLFVAHDLSVVRHIADRVAVMYLGGIVEIGQVDTVFDHPSHPYTQALLSAIPIPDPARERARRRIILKGDPPGPAETPSGCRFRTRCPKFAALAPELQEACIAKDPELLRQGDDHEAACHYAEPANVF